MKSKILEVDRVSYSYAGDSDPAVHDVSFAIDEGDFMAIIGPNGGGKSTLLKIVLGVLKPQSGTVRLLGENPQKSRIFAGYVPQETSSNKEFPITVHDVVLMGLTPLRGIGRHSTKGDHERTDEVLREFGLDHLRKKSISELSGGQRQKVLLSRALVSKPKILFLDEPTASVDATGVDEIYSHLEKLNEGGTTVVLVTHNVGVVSQYIKSVACINKNLYFHPDGKLDSETITKTFGCPVDLIAHGHPHRVFNDHKHDQDSSNPSGDHHA